MIPAIESYYDKNEIRYQLCFREYTKQYNVANILSVLYTFVEQYIGDNIHADLERQR